MLEHCLLPEFCFWICWLEIPHGHQGQFIVLLGPNFKNLLVRNHKVGWFVVLQKWFKDGPVPNLWIISQLEVQNGCHEETELNIGSYGNFTFSSSFGKTLNSFQPNLAEMVVRSFTRFVNRNWTWSQGPIMFSDWSKF